MAPERIRRRAPVDLLQFGKQPLEESALGHLQQPGRNAGTRAEQVEHAPAIVGIRYEIFGREAVEVFLNARADLIRNCLSVDDRESKCVDPDRRLQRRGVRI